MSILAVIWSTIFYFFFYFLNLLFFEDNKGGRTCTVEFMPPCIADVTCTWLLTCLSRPIYSSQHPDVVLFVVPVDERAIMKL
jgi:hypothetical protein